MSSVGVAHGIVAHDQVEGGVINAGEVAGTAWLVILWLQGKGIHVDTNSWDVGVVLVWLDQVEVLAFTLGESVMTVELDLGEDNWVLTGEALHAGHGVTREEDGAIPPVGVVEWLLTLPWVDDGVLAGQEGVALDNPHEFLGWVVEVQLDLVVAGGDGFSTSELELLDQVLVADLGEASALISVQVDVIHVQGGTDDTGVGNAVADAVSRTADGGVVPAEVAELVELEPDLDLVVLEGDQWEGQTWVAAEPELEWDVQGVFWGALADLVGGVWLTRSALIITALTGLDEQVHELWDVANHLGVTGLLTWLLGELVPDVEPVTVVLIDLLTTDLNVDIVDQVVANPVEPAELSTRTIGALEDNLWQGGLEVDTVDQITITGDGTLDLLTEVGGTIEGLFNGLHGEVGVAAVQTLEESDLWIASEVDILSAISDELHKTTRTHVCCLCLEFRK